MSLNSEKSSFITIMALKLGSVPLPFKLRGRLLRPAADRILQFTLAPAALGVLDSLPEVTSVCILQYYLNTESFQNFVSGTLKAVSFQGAKCAFEFYPEHLIFPDS